MSINSEEPAVKILINDLSGLEKCGSGWVLKLRDTTSDVINLSNIHIQGEIYKTTGFSNEILIIDDGSGKTKVTRSPQVPGDFTWVKTGELCSVVGTLTDNGKLPHVGAIKIAQIRNKNLQKMWPLEVKELQNLLTGKITFNLPVE